MRCFTALLQVWVLVHSLNEPLLYLLILKTFDNKFSQKTVAADQHYSDPSQFESETNNELRSISRTLKKTELQPGELELLSLKNKKKTNTGF